MKTIRADLPNTLDRIEIHPLADLHIGDMCCDFNLIKAELEYIKNTPNAYCILDGDLMNTAIKNSVSDIYSESVNPMEQLKKCVEIFSPTKEKILCVLGGNHERRIGRETSLDMTELMCSQLGIPERYSPTTAVLYVRFGSDHEHRDRKQVYSFYITHGQGGGRKTGGKVQRLADLAEIVDTDIYVMAHVHQPASIRNKFYRTDPRNSSVYSAEHLFVNTAAWLDYGGYGDIAGFKPASKINPIIYLNGDTKLARALI